MFQRAAANHWISAHLGYRVHVNVDSQALCRVDGFSRLECDGGRVIILVAVGEPGSLEGPEDTSPELGLRHVGTASGDRASLALGTSR